MQPRGGWRDRCRDRTADGASGRRRAGGRDGDLRQRPNHRRRDATPAGRSPALTENDVMQLAMIGLGRMGANMVRRLIKGGHQCVVFDMSSKVVNELVQDKAVGPSSLEDFANKL